MAPSRIKSTARDSRGDIVKIEKERSVPCFLLYSYPTLELLIKYLNYMVIS
jgi:hypothetical protein